MQFVERHIYGYEPFSRHLVPRATLGKGRDNREVTCLTLIGLYEMRQINAATVFRENLLLEKIRRIERILCTI